MKNITKKTEITKTEYLTLEGIRALSKKLNEDLERLVLCVSDITGEELDENNYGLAADFIFSPEEEVKNHLKKLGITINRKKF